MITASELRIGNWVMYNDQNETPTPVVIQINIADLALISDNNKYCNYQPIPLTEQILLDCGFDSNGIHIFKKFNPRMCLFFNYGNCAEMDLAQDEKYISFRAMHIKHLHELQNLYYALTKQELVWKQYSIRK